LVNLSVVPLAASSVVQLEAGIELSVLRGDIGVQEKETIRLKREAKTKGGFYVEPEQKLLFAIRIRGLNKVPPKVGVHLVDVRASCR
jgi:hypothetical protein